jgi:hypothetical protein
MKKVVKDVKYAEVQNAVNMNPYDNTINGGKKITLLYVDGDKKLCDGCDEKKKTAVIEMLCGDVAIICKDCLIDIINEF